MTDTIKIIDLFAGPGGLGEGFSSFQTSDCTFPFQIVASVEKEKSAHKTLTLRSFFRQFRNSRVPQEYYEYLRSDGNVDANRFFGDKFPEEWTAANKETLGAPKALGSDDHEDIFNAIREAIEDHPGPKIVIGGPPCQAYSLVGRARNKGNKGYSAENDARHFLYQEYLKVLDLVQPDVFVMENVKGILTAKVNGESIFEKIREDLHCPARALNSHNKQVEYDLLPLAHELNSEQKYSNKDFIIEAENYGVPQARHRVILLGVRKDLGKSLLTGELLGRWKTTEKVYPNQVLSDLPKLRSGLTKTQDKSFEYWKKSVFDGYIKATSSSAFTAEDKKYLFQKYQEARDFGRGGKFVPYLDDSESTSRMPKNLKAWYGDPRLLGTNNHYARNHMAEDIHRYFFASCFAARNNGVSPKPTDYTEDLAPDHKNWKSGKFSDRFKVQAEERVASTITSHISKDGHYFIHYDPSQCRSLTVREAARIQTFPDNYLFEGNRTEQYVQVGNAVPPLLAHHIADIVYRMISSLTTSRYEGSELERKGSSSFAAST